mgnify:FL=1
MRLLRALLLALLAGMPAAADDRPGMLPAEGHAAWQAIGRLNAAGYDRRRLCTATLIAPDEVLSAAHCVRQAGGRPVRMQDLRFVAGWFRGERAAVARISAVAVAPTWTGGQGGRGPLGDDVAILTLSAPLSIAPLPLAPPRAGEPVRILGYRADRPHALSDSGTCPHGRAAEGTRATPCQATFGTSGAPVLQDRDGTWHVVGVVSAIGGGQTYFAPWRAEHRDTLNSQ